MTYIYMHADLFELCLFLIFCFIAQLTLINKAIPLFKLKHFTTNNTVFEIHPYTCSRFFKIDHGSF